MWSTAGALAGNLPDLQMATPSDGREYGALVLGAAGAGKTALVTSLAAACTEEFPHLERHEKKHAKPDTLGTARTKDTQVVRVCILEKEKRKRRTPVFYAILVIVAFLPGNVVRELSRKRVFRMFILLA